VFAEDGSAHRFQIIDTVLVKLLAESEDTQELHSLLDSSENIVIEEVEETLIRTRHYTALVKMYQKRNNAIKLLDLWSKYAIRVPGWRIIIDTLSLGSWTVNGRTTKLKTLLSK
jgi:Vacuolar sorting protein 39 domain 1